MPWAKTVPTAGGNAAVSPPVTSGGGKGGCGGFGRGCGGGQMTQMMNMMGCGGMGGMGNPMGGNKGGGTEWLPAQPNDTIYVNGLPNDMTEDGMKDLFGAYGKVKWSKLLGGARKAALVQFSKIDEATFLVDNPEVLALQGKVSVEYQRVRADGKGWQPQQQQQQGSKVAIPLPGGLQQFKKDLQMMGALPGMAQGGRWNESDPSIWVGSLPSDTTKGDLYEIFSPFGAIPPEGIRLLLDRETQKFRGMAVVGFLDRACAESAIASMNRFQLRDGSQLKVDWNTHNKKKEDEAAFRAMG